MGRPNIETALTSKEVIVYHDVLRPYFNPRWHFHPEYQISMILKGRGMRYIGDHVQVFESGDLVFTGPNLPHLWRSEEACFETPEANKTRGLVLYFSETIIDGIVGLPERFPKMERLLGKSERGISFFGATREKIKALLLGFEGEIGFKRMVRLWQLLELMSESDEYELLAGMEYRNSFKGGDSEKMRLIHDYVAVNFRKKISADEIAESLNMSPSTFSRYFKPRANKTFTRFVNETRIGHAKRLLLEDDLNVVQISYECGYNALSNFNKQFKAIVGMRPMDFKKSYAKLKG